MAKSTLRVAVVTLAGVLLLNCCAGEAFKSNAKPPDVGGDWPQWRGPNRDGIAPHSPKLLDSWPKAGPKLLWKSGRIPYGYSGGGWGSPVVAEGKVFIYAQWWVPRDPKVKGYRIITDKILSDWGWQDGVPDALAKKIEAARLARNGKAGSPELKAYTQGFIATLAPEDAKKYGDFIQRRFNVGNDPHFFTWTELQKFAQKKDHEFEDLHEFRDLWTKMDEMPHHRYGGVEEAMKAAIKQACMLTDTVICLDAASGKELWKKWFPDPNDEALDGSDNNFGKFGCSATPCVSGGKCFAQGGSGLYCLSTKDGAVVWQVPTGHSHSSPVVVGAAVCVTTPCVTAYDTETGRKLWQQPKASGGNNTLDNSSLALWATGGKNYLIANHSSFCLDPQTGEVAGSNRLPSGHATPAIGEGYMALVSNEYPQQRVVSIKIGSDGGKISSEVAWAKDCTAGGDRNGSPIIYNGYVYCNGATYLKCFDLKTGELKWEEKAVIGGMFASACLADGKIITHLQNNYSPSPVLMYKATPEKYVQLGVFNPGAAECCTPAIAGGKLYLRCADDVACYDLTEAGNR